MARIHLHLLSDSTGETLENIAKAAIGLFENVEAIRHFWPMVRSDVHLDRIMEEIAANPQSLLKPIKPERAAPFTPVNA